MRRRFQGFLLVVTTLAAGCDPADEVRVQPLPPLERSTPEARAGLPEVEGVWRFAGWELAPDDSASLQRELPALGALQLQTQRLDSVAGFYQAGEGRLPLVGEVRRDSVLALVALSGPGQGYFLAGRVSRDTVWMSLTSLLEPGTWPTDARVAFVRSPVAAPFVRLHGAPPPALPVDSALAASLAAADSAAAAAGTVPGDTAAPAPTRPAATAPPMGTPPAAAPQTSAPQPRPAAPQPRPAAPQPATPRPTPPAPRPVAPRDTPTRRLPPLLGEPVRDTVRDTSSYSPVASRTSERPRSVSASRSGVER